MLRIRLDSPGLIGELVRRAVEDAAAWVGGPWWSVGPDHAAHQEACRRAAADARRRAEAFAAAPGAQVGPVVAAAEPVARGVDAGAFGFRPLSAARATGPGQDDLNVEAGQLELTVALDVAFALDPGPPDQQF